MRQCPRCRFTLGAVRLQKGIEVDHCEHCGGNFFDPGEETQLLGQFCSPQLWLDSDINKSLGPSELLSPISGRPMHSYRIFFREAVEIDRCEESGGLWLDKGEGDKLSKILTAASQSKTAQPTLQQQPQKGISTYLFQFFTGLPIEVWHPVSKPAYITFSLIIACITVFVYQLLQPNDGSNQDAFFNGLALQPTMLQGEAIWAVITYIFLHGSLTHLLGNMYFLLIFGDNVEDKLGRRAYLTLFLCSGAGGGLAELAFSSPDAIVGASGAIAGLMGSYWVLFRDVRVRMLIVGIPIYFGIGTHTALWVGVNVLALLIGIPGVAWWCHLGGFAVGALMAWPNRKRLFAEQMAEAKQAQNPIKSGE
jgi:membrane associated rhomboid family serine protease